MPDVSVVVADGSVGAEVTALGDVDQAHLAELPAFLVEMIDGPLGFGILFVGLSNMSAAVSSMSDSLTMPVCPPNSWD